MLDYHVHKEPVIDRNRRTYGHELLFRRADQPHENGPWPPTRLDEEMVRTLVPGGIEGIAGNKRVFLSLDGGAIKSDTTATLPKNCIIQVSNQDALDKDTLLRSTLLKKKGYQMVAEEGRLAPFHQIADFVRIGTSNLKEEDLAAATITYGAAVRKIATHVDTAAAFHEWRKGGFDLFQGSFFMDPATRPPEPISDSQIQLLRLSKDLRLNKEISVIEDSFKNSPKLTYGLLQIINSAFFGVSVKIVSIRQAITLMGYDRLLKWVVLLLFGVGLGNDQSNPVIEKAVVRGRVMESLARQTGQAAAADGAFITGMLSLFPVLFDIDLPALAMEMKLGHEIQDALLIKEGSLGTLLSVAENTDLQRYEAMGEDLALLKISTGDVLSAETDAIIHSQSRLFR
jgi:c-di-GMP-related signal transduction protein